MTAPLYDRIQDGIVTTIKALSLTDLAGGVVKQGDISSIDVELPCVIVSIHGEQERPLGGTTLYKHRSFGVRVIIVANDLLTPDDQAKILEWRAAMMDAFDRRGRDSTTGLVLTGCAEVFQTLVTPRPVFDENLKQFRYAVSGFVVDAEAAIRRS